MVRVSQWRKHLEDIRSDSRVSPTNKPPHNSDPTWIQKNKQIRAHVQDSHANMSRIKGKGQANSLPRFTLFTCCIGFTYVTYMTYSPRQIFMASVWKFKHNTSTKSRLVQVAGGQITRVQFNRQTKLFAIIMLIVSFCK